MKKLLILSGKGGTGKTTTASAFIDFAKAKVFADCDVDAPNLHIVSQMKGEEEKTDFYGSQKAFVKTEKCTGCGKCQEFCRFDAVKVMEGKAHIVDYTCEGCGLCQYVCPWDAVEMKDDVAGKLTLIKGESVFSTAILKMGRGNSGKLVSAVKTAMINAAPEEEIAIIDGSPGIGCPVIASMSGVDLVLIVAEPSMSGLSDLKRLVETADTFQTKVMVCVNKWDTNPEKTEEIKRFCQENNTPWAGQVPYDKSVSIAINEGRSISKIQCPARDALYDIYMKTMEEIYQN